MRNLATLAALALVCSTAFGQKTDLNPTVTVSSKFVGKLSQSEMMTSGTVIPDSLYRFDLDFDYTGFETPYKGNDLFNPIHTDLDMSPRAYDGKRFDMTAGAGYLVPVRFDMNAVLKRFGRFKLGMYASNDSFWGSYHNVVNSGGELLPDRTLWQGFDSRSKAGLDARLDWTKSHLLMNLRYDGIHASTQNLSQSRNYYNSAGCDFSFRYRSDRSFRMGADFSYTCGFLDAGGRPSAGGDPVYSNLIENVYKAGLDFQFDVGHGHLLELDADFNMVDAFGGPKGSSYGGWNISLSPLYYFSGSDKLYFGIGISLLYSGSYASVNTGNAFTGFPCLKFKWKVLRDNMVIYADSHLDGEVWGVRSNALQNVFMVADEQKYTVKNYKASLGLQGNVGGKFYYDFSGGYTNVQNAPLYQVIAASQTPYSTTVPLTTIMRHEENLRSVDAKGKIMAKFGGLSISADALYHFYIGRETMVSVPNEFDVSGDVRYDFRTRFYIHAGAGWVSAYKAGDYTTPGYVDLKAGLGFNFRKSFGIFLEGENLLNHCRQSVPLYGRTGPEVLLGVRFLY